MTDHTDDELWCFADGMLRDHGEDATFVAAQKADDLLGEADLDGAHRWRIVVRRINILLERPCGPLH